MEEMEGKRRIVVVGVGGEVINRQQEAVYLIRCAVALFSLTYDETFVGELASDGKIREEKLLSTAALQMILILCYIKGDQHKEGVRRTRFLCPCLSKSHTTNVSQLAQEIEEIGEDGW